MAFRKRNVTVGSSLASASTVIESTSGIPTSGVRPSPLTSQPVTSTGAPSLDGLLGGHAGLALGSSLLVEESGSTDFSGALLRYFAAEGICQGHNVHIVGAGEQWVRELPGVSDDKGRDKHAKVAEEEKMKIAWRYERLGQAGERALPDRGSSTTALGGTQVTPFCHTFDLTKRLVAPPDAKISYIAISPSATFDSILQSISRSLDASSPNTVHRLIMPSMLSPALYPPTAGRPEHLLGFFRSLRALLRQHSGRLVAMITLPLELYPRNTALVRWAESLSDGVFELTPFPHLMDASNALAESGGARSGDEQPQGMVKIHKLPINTERGEGGAGAGNSLGEDLAFTVSRRKFVIKPFSLPPLEGDQEAQQEAGKLTAKDIEF
ncbi:related to RNA polymerase II elongator complex, subunit ELP4 [Ramularia collo-cygni]|uniref:Elongator complex protein 4 n=1 Tax=Ramularia collo-cygni TaxID=112498 RepID=A0A2D3V848_9PEZI|nr:related to RNA polymerase II elongator complex, subunit ELP4 [Ramularia collo-cygni]CZT25661.1 related to RNA polymerase II elongator complex, subunit ELP4 [Ramularia collo-cygni]